MNTYDYYLTLDLSGRNPDQYIYAKQGDDVGRKVHITLTNDGEPYTVGAGTTAEIRCRKPSGKVFMDTAQVSGSAVTVTLKEQALAEPGPTLADIALRDSAGLLSTTSFTIRVNESGSNGHNIASTNEFLNIEKLVKESAKSAEAAKEAQAGAEKAKAQTDEVYKKAEEIVRISDLGAEITVNGPALQIPGENSPEITALKLVGQSTQKTTTGKNLIPWPYDDSVVETNGIKVTENADGSLTFNGTATGECRFYFGKNVQVDFSGKRVLGGVSSSCVMCIQEAGSDYTMFAADSGNGATCANTDGVSVNVFFLIYSGASFSNKTVYPMIYDAETDPTYEPPTNGPSPNPSYPQTISSVGDSGEIKVASSVSNEYKAWINMSNSYLVPSSDSSSMRIPCLPNKKYTVSVDYSIANTKLFRAGWTSSEATSGDSSVPLNGCVDSSDGSALIINTGDNAKYLIIQLNSAYFSQLAKTMTIEADGEVFRPYLLASLTTGLPLCGIPVSSGGNVTIDGQSYWSDIFEVNADGSGQVESKCNILSFDGSESWRIYESHTGSIWFMINLGGDLAYLFVPSGNQPQGMCSRYRSVSANDSFLGEEGFTLANSDGIYIADHNIASIDAWKAKLKEWSDAGEPLTVAYVLKIPSTHTLTPAEVRAVLALGTYQPITNVSNDAGAEMSVKYATGVRGEFAGLSKRSTVNHLGQIIELQDRIADLEAAATSTA